MSVYDSYLLSTYSLIQFQFVRKVYATLLSQLLITIGFIAVFVFVKPIKEFYCDGVRVDENGLGHCIQRSQNGFIMYIVSYVIFFITYIAIACCESVRRKSPANMIAMAIFTLSLSVWVRFLTSILRFLTAILHRGLQIWFWFFRYLSFTFRSLFYLKFYIPFLFEILYPFSI